MSITFVCQYCRKEVKAPESAAGKRGKCPHCGETSFIPDPAVADDEIPLAPIDEEDEKTEAATEQREDYRAEDLYPFVVSYCVDMANSQLERAQTSARKLKQYGFTGIQAVDDFIQGREIDPNLDSIPPKLMQAFLKQLRDDLRKATGSK